MSCKLPKTHFDALMAKTRKADREAKEEVADGPAEHEADCSTPASKTVRHNGTTPMQRVQPPAEAPEAQPADKPQPAPQQPAPKEPKETSSAREFALYKHDMNKLITAMQQQLDGQAKQIADLQQQLAAVNEQCADNGTVAAAATTAVAAVAADLSAHVESHAESDAKQAAAHAKHTAELKAEVTKAATDVAAKVAEQAVSQQASRPASYAAAAGASQPVKQPPAPQAAQRIGGRRVPTRLMLVPAKRETKSVMKQGEGLGVVREVLKGFGLSHIPVDAVRTHSQKPLIFFEMGGMNHAMALQDAARSEAGRKALAKLGWRMTEALAPELLRARDRMYEQHGVRIKAAAAQPGTWLIWSDDYTIVYTAKANQAKEELARLLPPPPSPRPSPK